MFKNVYGVVGSPESHSTYFVHKVINVQESVQIYAIGGLFGEDVPFNGTIYIVKWLDKLIPFISKREIKLGNVTFDKFNQSEWVKKRCGEINVTSFEISHLGFNLKNFSSGPRGSVDYLRVFTDENFHGYQFESATEYEKVISFIKEGIPLLRFNDYNMLHSNPSVCIDVHLADHKTVQLSKDALSEKIESVIHTLNEDLETAQTFMQFIKDYSGPALTIEQLTRKLIDMERIIFYKTWQAYPLVYWSDQNFIEILKDTYTSYLSSHYPNFEQFLLSISNLIRNRYYGRLIFEKYLPPDEIYYY